jgi:hypothetical protein
LARPPRVPAPRRAGPARPGPVAEYRAALDGIARRCALTLAAGRPLCILSHFRAGRDSAEQPEHRTGPLGVEHALWMLGRVAALARGRGGAADLLKANRWLGFAQAAMAGLGCVDVAWLRDATRDALAGPEAGLGLRAGRLPGRSRRHRMQLFDDRA